MFVQGSSCPTGMTPIQAVTSTGSSLGTADLNYGLPSYMKVIGCVLYSAAQDTIRNLLVTANRCPSGFKKNPFNLNNGVPGATKLYLCAYRDTVGAPPAPAYVADVRAVYRTTRCPAGMSKVVQWSNEKPANLNQGTKGRAVYLCVRSEPLGPAPPDNSPRPSPSPPVAESRDLGCGTMGVRPSEDDRVKLDVVGAFLTENLFLAGATFASNIQVVYHVIHNASSFTQPSAQVLQNQTKVSIA